MELYYFLTGTAFGYVLGTVIVLLVRKMHISHAKVKEKGFSKATVFMQMRADAKELHAREDESAGEFKS